MTLEELTELNNATADIEENGYIEEHKKRSVLIINDTETIIKSYHSPYIIDQQRDITRNMSTTA